MEKLVDRFLKYVKIDTQSNESSETYPSTPSQLEFSKLLAEEISEIGLKDVHLDKNGYLMATLPANIKEHVPVIGFIAHVDTSPDFTGKNVNPKIFDNYFGKNLLLNEKKNIMLSPREFPLLNNYIGQPIIATDGTTLLGADNKAGIAEILTAMEVLIQNPDIKHGTIKIAFTPDEEIGRGANKFDVKKFGADFAFTVDGGPIGELEYENFNAASAKISIQGRNVHPGTAKNRMKNSMRIAQELDNMLPQNEKPEYTEAYEGFYHLTEFNGTVDHTKVSYIIRDHDKDEFMKKKDLLVKIVDHLNIKYGKGTVKLIMVDQYYNMREKIEPVFHIIELVIKAMNEAGVTPKVKPIRGGTDGARLSYMGLPCPNIFTGGHNFHSRYEFIPIRAMEKAVKVIVKIVEINARQKQN
ncbi:MAG: peptidase T [Bacteroidales bacterium]|nr:peptidase T [Bacteroidales bacterium]